MMWELQSKPLFDLVNLNFFGEFNELASMDLHDRSDDLNFIFVDFDLWPRQLKHKLNQLFLHWLLGTSLNECIESLLFERVL